MQFVFRNVNSAFQVLVGQIYSGEITTEVFQSRAGEVLRIPEPVLIRYLRPTERVLFNVNRDANPFFHLYEALWMLCGRNDVAPLDYYCGNYGVTTSDDGKTANGAYGARWRTPFVDEDLGTVDQLKAIVEAFRADPNTRRAVLQMWSVQEDLLKIGGVTLRCEECDGRGFLDDQGYDLGYPQCGICKGSGRVEVAKSKDVCCNTHIYFSRREGTLCSDLEMTVCNRSNDLVWGLLGANYVHFSILQEYLAAQLGLSVGNYNHFTNDLHVYTSRFDPEYWMTPYHPIRTMHSPPNPTYDHGTYRSVPLIEDVKTFDAEKLIIVEEFASSDTYAGRSYTEPWLQTVARPALAAFRHHKRREYDLALDTASRIEATDWKIVAVNWIKKRKLNWEKKGETSSG